MVPRSIPVTPLPLPPCCNLISLQCLTSTWSWSMILGTNVPLRSLEVWNNPHDGITGCDWNLDGSPPLIFSMDRYVSVLTFNEGGLGEPLHALPPIGRNLTVKNYLGVSAASNSKTVTGKPVPPPPQFQRLQSRLAPQIPPNPPLSLSLLWVWTTEPPPHTYPPNIIPKNRAYDENYNLRYGDSRSPTPCYQEEEESRPDDTGDALRATPKALFEYDILGEWGVCTL